jgi:AraC family transcriptional regulator
MTFQGRKVPFFSGSDFNSADHPWAGYSFEEGLSKAEPLRSHTWPKTTIFLCTGGEHGTVSFKHRGIWTKDHVRSGYLFMARSDAEIQERRASHVWPVMVLQLDSSKLVHMAPDQMRAIERSLVSMLGTSDDRLTTLLQALREEVREGCPSGRLYAESMSLALLAYLAGTYATPRLADDRAATLSPAQKRGIVDYVRANLASDIAVTELAALVHMSPSHFSRVFKVSFGLSPYRYVMQQRIVAAKDLLAGTALSASQVATSFGFSSQSHFVKVFRQFTGVTPKQFRAGL